LSAQNFPPPDYKGRFAPSPTGPLHLGSLYTALASFLQARSKQGQWFVRIDDLDTPRNVKGVDFDIIKTLKTFGLDWDGEVFYQSEHLETYQAFIEQLIKVGKVYPCTCSRKTLAAFHSESNIYPKFCRDKTEIPTEPYALRLKTESLNIGFDDFLQGRISHNIAEKDGDFIIKRKEGIIAYQFAVVIDDYQQQITEVVRGFDLLDCTPPQIYLHQVLGLRPPAYLHVPILTDQHGQKLSKQSFAQAVSRENPVQTLFYLLTLLKQQPPFELQHASISELLEWAIENWQPQQLKNSHMLAISSNKIAATNNYLITTLNLEIT
jgi:glutamyl-Q tRNA(Asp) synthetase